MTADLALDLVGVAAGFALAHRLRDPIERRSRNAKAPR